ncbi:MAG: thiamine phosphate synthase, partial [Acidobacteriota bacterium]
QWRRLLPDGKVSRRRLVKITLPKIYPVTDKRISGLTHLEQVSRLIAGGASIIQLRDKSANAGEFYQAAAEVVTFANRQGVKIIINDRADIALASGAAGVHLGQEDLSPIHARDLLGPNAIIGFSTHSLAQAEAALALPVDYLAIGPIFATSTKTDHDPIVGLDGLRAVRKLDPNIPVVAIGGVDRGNAELVIGSGADCVATIRDLLGEPSAITERTRELRLLLRDRLINIVGNS